MTIKDKDVLNFFFETGMLKRIKHEGWRAAGVEFPDSVAEHTLRAAQIGYILADLEGYDNPERVAAMLVFHEIGEARIGDLHRLAKSYVNADERRAVSDQLKTFGKLGENILSLWDEIENQETVAGKIAKDADWLEQSVTAKEYMEQGFKKARIWIENGLKMSHTKTARALTKKLLKMNSKDWWISLKENRER